MANESQQTVEQAIREIEQEATTLLSTSQLIQQLQECGFTLQPRDREDWETVADVRAQLALSNYRNAKRQ